MSGARSRNRGAESERMVVAWLRTVGFPDARRYLAGDGRQPGDIDAIPGVCIEVKSQSNGTSWPSWVRQAVLEAGPDRVPVVVRRTPGNPNVGEWVAVTPWRDEMDGADAMPTVRPDHLSIVHSARYEAQLVEAKACADIVWTDGACCGFVFHKGLLVARFADLLAALDAYPVEVER